METLASWGINDTDIPLAAVVIRLIAAAFLGGLIGLERELTRHSSGFRTNMLVAVAAAIFTVLTMEIFNFMADTGGDTARLDPIRVIEAVTAGVAFLAAGSIIRAGTEVKGLTTGAAMWMAGAVGVACGAGFLVIAVLGAVLALIVTFVLKPVEDRMLRRREGDES